MHCNKASAALGNFLNEVIADPPGEELYDALHMSLRVSGRILLFRIRGGSFRPAGVKGTILRANELDMDGITQWIFGWTFSVVDVE